MTKVPLSGRDPTPGEMRLDVARALAHAEAAAEAQLRLGGEILETILTCGLSTTMAPIAEALQTPIDSGVGSTVFANITTVSET